MEFEIVINAPKEKVWEALWNEDTYPQWTAAFSPGSKAVTDWKKGSKVLFVDHTNNGMFAMIEESIPGKFMSIRHMGGYNDGVEDTESEMAKQWAGSHEDYHLSDAGGGTKLEVKLYGATIPKEFEEEFKKAWPIALDKLKELSEK